MREWIVNYIEAEKAALDSIPVEQVESIILKFKEAHAEGRQIFVFGNGGSASNASHFATDLGKGSSDALGKRFKVLSLNDNVSWMTAIGNDYSYEDIYLRQLENYGQARDIVLTMSVSGSSPNLVKAFEWAHEIELGYTITSSTFWSFYYTAAGLHAAHVIAGAIIMGIVAVAAAKNRELHRVELIGIYWHFVDLVWIFLFPLLYIAK